MPYFKRDQVSLYYEVIGVQGDWIVLTPGGRGSLEDVRYLANVLALKGYRILLHDRRNCGRSDVFIDGELSEQEVWVEDVQALLEQLEATPVIAWRFCRLSIVAVTGAEVPDIGARVTTLVGHRWTTRGSASGTGVLRTIH